MHEKFICRESKSMFEAGLLLQIKIIILFFFKGKKKSSSEFIPDYLSNIYDLYETKQNKNI